MPRFPAPDPRWRRTPPRCAEYKDRASGIVSGIGILRRQSASAPAYNSIVSHTGISRGRRVYVPIADSVQINRNIAG